MSIKMAAAAGTRINERDRRYARPLMPREAAPAPHTEQDEIRFIEGWRGAAKSGPPFLSADFFLHTAELIGQTPVIVVGGRPEARSFLPLFRRGRELLALRSDHSPRYDLSGNPAGLPDVWRVLHDCTGWDVLTLRSVPVTSPLVRVLPGLARADGCEVVLRPVGRAPFLQLSDFARELDGRFRREMSRRERQLTGMHYERITIADPHALDSVLELEGSGWKRDAGTALALDSRLCRFYRQVARGFARSGQLDLAFLEVGGRRVAAHFAAEDNHTYYLLKTGYDPEFSRYGVGHLLVREAALDARRRGLRRLDFLGRDSNWKRQWTRAGLPHVELRLYRPTWRGRVRHGATERIRPLAARIARSIRLW